MIYHVLLASIPHTFHEKNIPLNDHFIPFLIEPYTAHGHQSCRSPGVVGTRPRRIATCDSGVQWPAAETLGKC